MNGFVENIVYQIDRHSVNDLTLNGFPMPLSVWLAQLVKSLAASVCLLKQKVTGSIPGADGLTQAINLLGSVK